MRWILLAALFTSLTACPASDDGTGSAGGDAAGDAGIDVATDGQGGPDVATDSQPDAASREDIATDTGGPDAATSDTATSDTASADGADTPAMVDARPGHDPTLPDLPAEGIDPCSGNPYTLTVPSNAHPSAPDGSTADQITAQATLNALRNRMGLGPIALHPALNECSQAHSDYCTADPSWCPGWHSEVPGHEGFTGESFGQRCSAAGYSGAVFEVMAPGVGPEASIDMWMNSVYHRTPFVTPRIDEAGYGGAASYVTMDFGCCGPHDTALVTNYPVHGQNGIWRRFLGNEGPEPPEPPNGWPSGPIVSIIFPQDDGVAINEHTIYDDTCSALPHLAGGMDLANTAGFDLRFLDPTLLLYTHDALQSGREYTVNVEYTLDGVAGHRTFAFTIE